MRCIEITLMSTLYRDILGLIETWDVLKSLSKLKKSGDKLRLIETWDVLK